MRFEWFIALRYLRTRKQSAFLNTISVISIAGVMVGVAALIVVISVMAGFEEQLREKILGVNAHGNVYSIRAGMPSYREDVKAIESVPGVVGATPFIIREVMITSEENVTGAMFKGIDPVSCDKVTRLTRYIDDYHDNESKERAKLGLDNPSPWPKGSLLYLNDTKALRLLGLPKGAGLDGGMNSLAVMNRTKRKWGDKELPGIVIGKEMAVLLGVHVGDEINVVDPIGGGIGPTGPVPSNQYFRVAAIFYSGMFEFDMKFAYTTLKELQTFSNMDDMVTAIEFKVRDDKIFDTKAIGEQIMAKLGGFPYQFRDWMDMNRNLFSALKMEQLVMFIILTFITLVAAFNIASTLIMMVIEKTKEIAILKSMGAGRGRIMSVFMIDGLVIGLLGTTIGTLLGFGLCALVPILDYQLDEGVYYMTTLPVKIIPLNIVVIVLSALGISWLATLYPSWKASRLDPVEGLRNE